MKAEELREGMRFLVKDGNCVEYAGLGNKGEVVEPKIVDTEDGKVEEVTEKEDLLTTVAEEKGETKELIPDQAMFEIFETGVIYFCPLAEVESAMERFEFKRLHSEEWMRRVVALNEYQKDPKSYATYLDVYEAMLTEATDEEVTAIYKAQQK